jgi:single-stranded-DNA-specific exonuclease
MIKRRWVYPEQPGQESIDALSKAINVNTSLASLLIKRGITDLTSAKNFFRPDRSMLHDPFLMKDMEFAVKRLKQAVDKKERILVYGDYDVDGTTSVAVVYGYLQGINADCLFYVPDRNKEGYGVSETGIDWAISKNVQLIISVDLGIKSSAMVRKSSEAGIDFIICDHHLPDEHIPSAVAVLDPKRPDCEYPYKELSGCGIGFKLIQGYARRYADEEVVFSYLDLLAVSISSDIVPLTGENRILTFFGLKKLNENPRPGLKALMERSGVMRALDVSSIVFTLGPRINAAGRIESGKQAVELLIAENRQVATMYGQAIDKNNTTRKGLNESITKDALSIIEQDSGFLKRKSTVLYNPEWHKGVIGIVASKLTDEFYRPTVILTESNGVVSGSARSVKDFDVYNAIESCSDLLEQFGGHMYAAGLTLRTENVEAFKTRFEEVVSATKNTYID